MTEEKKKPFELMGVLKALNRGLNDFGFPTEPLFIENSPEEKERYFIALWRNDGERKLEKIEAPNRKEVFLS
jgi:hypothetical protein